MAGAVMKVLLPTRIFDDSALLEDSKEVSTVGIISPQLVIPILLFWCTFRFLPSRFPVWVDLFPYIEEELERANVMSS
ncbi:hypothetical protein C5S39_13950 [Candidatus Methanophagaceae archaeon]|jgi:uncharacterized BrkB/YihY/UPF0761 family membrane protein|nr:hypothetical protein C5S39_13950 [Methanophagales archaeon]